MLATQTKDLLSELRRGRLDVGHASFLEQIAPEELKLELQSEYPVVFLNHAIGRKQEIGFARSVRWEIRSRVSAASPFASILLLPVLRHCLFLSSYDDHISEVTFAAKIRLLNRPKGNVVLKMVNGYKLDRTVDGWSVKRVQERPVELSTEMLARRGWRFDAVLASMPLR